MKHKTSQYANIGTDCYSAKQVTIHIINVITSRKNHGHPQQESS